MNNLVWTDRLSVGVNDFDEEHKLILIVIDRLFTAYNDGTLVKNIGFIFDELIIYVDGHFRHEEDVLRQHSYPKLRDQEIAHVRFASSVVKLKGEWAQGKSQDTILKLAELLREWLVEHINGMDKQYTDYLNSRGIS